MAKEVCVGADGLLRGQAEMLGVGLACREPGLKSGRCVHQNARQEVGTRWLQAAAQYQLLGSSFLAKLGTYARG